MAIFLVHVFIGMFRVYRSSVICTWSTDTAAWRDRHMVVSSGARVFRVALRQSLKSGFKKRLKPYEEASLPDIFSPAPDSKRLMAYWVAVKGLYLSYYIGEAILITANIHYDNLK